MLLLRDSADRAKPWICSFRAGRAGWVHPWWDPVAWLCAAQECLSGSG